MLLLLKNYFLFKQVPRETNQNSLSYKLEKFIFFVYILKLFIYVSLTKVTDFQFFVFVFFYFYNFMWLSYLKYKLNINFNLFWCLKNFIFNFINFKCNLFHKNNLKQKILKNQNLLEFNLFNFYNIILYNKLVAFTKFIVLKLVKKKNLKNLYTDYPNDFMNKLLEIKRISHTKEKGRVRKFRVIFIFGNKTGWVGFGRGKSFFIAGALLKAKQNALKNIKYVHLNSLKTIPHVIIYKFKKTKIILKPSYVGGGLRAPLFIKPLLEISGYKNLGFIIIGSSNKLNVFNSFFFSMTTVVSKKELFNLDLLNFNTNKAAQPFNSILNLLIHC